MKKKMKGDMLSTTRMAVESPIYKSVVGSTTVFVVSLS